MKSVVLYIQKICLTGLFMFAIAGTLSAKNDPGAYEDQCYVHLDKSFYVTGEVVWFKLYLPPLLKDKPTTIRAFVFDSNKNPVRDFFLQSEGKTYVHGYYPIPFNAPSGVWSLVFTGQNEAYQSVTKLAEIPLPIYNDLEPAQIEKTDLHVPVQGVSNPVTEAGALQVSIRLPKNKFGTREEIRPEITVKDAAGNPVSANLSVSVTDLVMTGPEVLEPNNFRRGETHDLLIFDNLNAGLFYPGFYLNDDGAPVQANIIGVWSNLENRMFFTKSDEKGRFFMKMPDFEGEKPVQFLAYNDTSNI
ncbi:MAG: hypothetical protein D6714_09565, partial [Bacteroidetes bacterium]